MSLFKKYRAFIESIKPYGLYTEISKKHLKIMKDGKMVTSVSLTPRETEVAIDHTLRHLIKDGHLPKINRSHYEHGLKQLARSKQ